METWQDFLRRIANELQDEYDSHAACEIAKWISEHSGPTGKVGRLTSALAERDAEIDEMKGWFARLYDYAAEATSEGLWFGANNPPETPAAFCDWLVSLWGNANSWKSRVATLEAQYRHDHEASPDNIDRCRLCHLGVRDPIHPRKESPHA